MQFALKTFASALITLALVGPAHAAAIVIDNFSTAQSTEGVVDGAGILGGERDLGFTAGHTVNIGSGSAVITLASPGDTNFVILEYDGNDNTTNTGYLLGGVDLTGGGTNDGFYISVTSVTGTIETLVRVGENASSLSDVGLNISTTGTVRIPFSSFPVVPGVNFASVERLLIRFILGADEAITVRVVVAANELLFSNGFE